MHCSIWTWHGDPDDLAQRYEALVSSIPAESMRFSACAKTADGIVVFDTCPTEEIFEAFQASEGFRSLLAEHGLGDPTSLDHGPAVVAFADGRRVDREEGPA